jgi:glycine betaine/proline transport system ATP-binding protein
MDEAFSALDPLIRTEMQDELLTLQSEHQRTIVFISHDLDEAIRIGDRIAIMQNGEISQVGTPEEIINNPANDYVKSFFKGVDVTTVLTASHIAKKSYPTIIKKDGFGINSAIQYINDYDVDFAYYLTKDNKYLGVLSLDALKEQKKIDGNIDDSLIKQEVVNENDSIADFINIIAESAFPIAVIAENGKYKGVISKRTLLKTIDEGAING